MSKKLIGVGLLTAIILSLGGCSDSSTATKQETSAVSEEERKAEDEKITLRFCWWGNEERHTSTVEALDIYMEQNPNVTIISEFLGWDGYLEKLTAQLMSDTSPDIMQIDPAWIMQFWQMEDKFVDMNSQQIIDMGLFEEYSGMLETFTSPSGK